MTSDKLREYIRIAREDMRSKLNIDRKKSIQRARGIQAAEVKITAEPESTHLIKAFIKTDQVRPSIQEEAATNSAGGGAVAGIGVGPDGEPGVSKARQRARAILLGRMMKRFKDASNLKR